MKDTLDAFGNWQNPDQVIDQATVGRFLDQLVETTSSDSPAFPILRAIRAQFDTLSREEYFSEIGRRLVFRHLAEAMEAGRSVNACRRLEDLLDPATDKILEIVHADLYRDGGSRFLVLNTTAGEIFLLLPVELTDDDASSYSQLFPCDFPDLPYFLPIPKDSAAESFLLAGARSCLANSRGLDPSVQERTLEFLSLAEAR